MTKDKELREVAGEIGGICLSFLFDQYQSGTVVENINNKFIKDDRDGLKLRMFYGSIPEIRGGEKIFDSGSTWSIFHSEGRYVLQDCPYKAGSSPDRLLILESDFKSGEFYTRNNEFSKNLLRDPLAYPLNQILHIILLSQGKGIIQHACGIDDRGLGYLFLGKSTNGKSTIAKLWSESGATVLNDDRIIIREKDGEFWLYGTPWHGTFNEVSPKALRIRKIFFLRHGEKNSAVPRKGAEAVSMLLTRSFPPLWDQKGMDYTLGLLDRMASRLPCYELDFLPDKKIIDFVRNI